MYTKGDRVKHPTRPEWGVGQILETIGENKIKVFFVNDGEKILDITIAKLVKVTGAEAAHPALDNPRPKTIVRPRKLPATKHFSNLQEAIHYFLRQFPEGFASEGFLGTERQYKLDANELFLQLLSADDFSQLLKAGSYDEICSRASQIMNKTNLVFPQEKIAFRNSLETVDNRKSFAETLYSLLYGQEDYEIRFKGFAECLQRIGADKWTIVTYYPFLRYPKKQMFLKPMATQRAAAACNFELNYHPKLNWLTYTSLLGFSQRLLDDLKAGGLKPRDMIDVQSFIWCIDQDR